MSIHFVSFLLLASSLQAVAGTRWCIGDMTSALTSFFQRNKNRDSARGHYRRIQERYEQLKAQNRVQLTKRDGLTVATVDNGDRYFMRPDDSIVGRCKWGYCEFYSLDGQSVGMHPIPQIEGEVITIDPSDGSLYAIKHDGSLEGRFPLGGHINSEKIARTVYLEKRSRLRLMVDRSIRLQEGTDGSTTLVGFISTIGYHTYVYRIDGSRAAILPPYAGVVREFDEEDIHGIMHRVKHDHFEYLLERESKFLYQSLFNRSLDQRALGGLQRAHIALKGDRADILRAFGFSDEEVLAFQALWLLNNMEIPMRRLTLQDFDVIKAARVAKLGQEQGDVMQALRSRFTDREIGHLRIGEVL